LATANRKPRTAPAQEIRSVALYARVSTHRDQNPEIQLHELRQYAERRSLEIVSEYVDHGISGAKDSRPQLDRMMADAHRRRFDAIVVWKLDRFGRTLKHLVTAIEDLAAYGVGFVSLRDNLDLSTPQGRLLFHMIAAMAEFERELIRERVLAGIAHARAHGRPIGRPRVTVDAHAVAALRLSGCSWSQICQRLNVSKGSAQRAAASVAMEAVQ